MSVILINPVAVVQAISLLFHFDWKNAVAFVVVIIGGIVIEIILIHIHDSRVWKDIVNQYFRNFDDCFFEPTQVKLEQALKSIKEMLRLRYPFEMYSLGRYLMPKIRAFYVRPRSTSTRRLPSGQKAYQMAGGTSYAFVAQEPEKMTSVARFSLLHEIGHALVINRLIFTQGWFAVTYLCLLFVYVALHREAGLVPVLVAFTLASGWALYWVQQEHSEGRLEIAADTFALVHLSGRPDFRKAIAMIASLLHQQSKWRYRARVLAQRAQILSRPTLKDRVRTGEGIYWPTQMIIPVPLWLAIFILSGLFWLGATLSINTWEEVLVLGWIWVFFPAVGHYYYMFLRKRRPRTSLARHEALAFLQNHAPPDLPKERQVTLFDLV